MHNCVSLWSSILLWNQKVDLPGKGGKRGGGSPVIKVLVSERPLTVRAINLVWGCSVGTQVSVLSWLYNWLRLGLFIHNKCVKYLFTKKVAFKFRHYKFVVHQLLNICWKRYCLHIFCSDCADLFLMLAFFHLFCLKWFLIQSCIIDYLKLTNKIHAPYLYRYKLLKHTVSKHLNVFSWLQTPHFIWLLLMKLFIKYISESVYRQTGVCLGQM